MAYVGDYYEVQVGSASLATSITGTVVSEQRYYPYGQVRWTSSAMPTDRTFTGQRSDSYSNMLDMGARWYSPLLGRFISPDSIVPGTSNPQNWNRYTYVRNNPLKLVDPDGHAPTPPQGLYDAVKETVDNLAESIYPCAHPCANTLANNLASTYSAIVALDGINRYQARVEVPLPRNDASQKSVCCDLLLSNNTYYEIKPLEPFGGKDVPWLPEYRGDTQAQLSRYTSTGAKPAPAVTPYYIDLSRWMPNSAIEVSSNGQEGVLYWRVTDLDKVPQGAPVVMPVLVEKPKPSPVQVALANAYYSINEWLRLTVWRLEHMQPMWPGPVPGTSSRMQRQ